MLTLNSAELCRVNSLEAKTANRTTTETINPVPTREAKATAVQSEKRSFGRRFLAALLISFSAVSV